jgi:hypothetical protein
VGEENSFCLRDSAGEVRRRTMTHRRDGFEKFRSRLPDATEGNLSWVVVGVEGHNGLMDLHGIGTTTARQYFEGLAVLESDGALLEVMEG